MATPAEGRLKCGMCAHKNILRSARPLAAVALSAPESSVRSQQQAQLFGRARHDPSPDPRGGGLVGDNLLNWENRRRRSFVQDRENIVRI